MPRPAAIETITIGDITVTNLPDGVGPVDPLGFFPGSDPAVWHNHPQYLDGQGRMAGGFGGLLVRTRGKTVLIDGGFGPRRRDLPIGYFEGGQLLDNLARVDVTPSDIDLVLFTHLHCDHAGWSARETSGGWEPTFPNATYLIRKAEWDMWAGQDHFMALSLAEENAIAPRVELFEEDQTVAPGVDAVLTAGHTLGHTSYVISSGDGRAVVLGDVVHCPVQLGEPELQSMADAVPELARQTREKILAEMSNGSTLLHAAHFPDFAFGRLAVEVQTRTWLPA